MIDIIVISILAVIIVGVSVYMIKQKKKGKKCIGCPYSCECSKKNCH